MLDYPAWIATKSRERRMKQGLLLGQSVVATQMDRRSRLCQDLQLSGIPAISKHSIGLHVQTVWDKQHQFDVEPNSTFQSVEDGS
jgi:hypothetical protein